MESLFFPLILALLAVFMFLSMRKQKKRATEMQEMQNSVQTGTRVQLTSGLYGTVIDAASSDFVDIEIATGLVTRWNRLAVMRVIPTEEAAATYPGYVEVDEDDDAIEGHTESDVPLEEPALDNPTLDKPSEDK